MNDYETQTLLALARARTPAQRREALVRATSRAVVVTPDVRAELRPLLGETAERAGSRLVLRPLPDPRNESGGILVGVAPGPDPILPAGQLGDIDEWCEGWRRVDELLAAGATAPGPLLFAGAPGTGKSTAVAAIARRFPDRPTACLDAHRVEGARLGETGGRIAKAFEIAKRMGAVLVLEEIDGLGNRRDTGTEAGAEMARACITILRTLDTERLPVVMTTNRPSALDPALVRRCEAVLVFDEPPPAERARIVERHLGAPPPDVEGVPLAHLVPLATRARRRAVLRQTSAVDEYAGLVATWRSP